MKKTTNIHLSGIIFNIEEDAYEKLSHYLKSIETHFSNHTGKKEILEDIENRIAEILSSKVSNYKQVVTLEDVNEVIQTLGEVDQFETESGQSEKQEYSTTIKKRFYRNPDDKIIGGVCGGIAAYFDIDPLWIRLAWAIAFFVFGTGLFVYILLWIIIPEAQTPSQKLEMRGEQINLSNISKGITEDLNQLKNKASNEFSNLSSNKFIAFFQSLFSEVLQFIIKIIKWSAKALAIFVFFICLFILVVLLASIFGETSVYISTQVFNASLMTSQFFDTTFQYIAFKIAIFLILVVPILYLLSLLIKLLFNIKKNFKYISFTALVLWISGWFIFVPIIIQIVDRYSEKSYSKSAIAKYIIPNKTIYIKMNETYEDVNMDEKNFKIKLSNVFYYSSDASSKNIGYPSVILRKSKDDSLRINIIHSALAETPKQAKKYAQNIQYSFSINDSIIELNPFFNIPKEDQFHFQRVKLIIEIPSNRYVYLSKNMKHFLIDTENNLNLDEDEIVGNKWLMGIDQLQCVENCEEYKAKSYQSKINKIKDENDEEEDGE